MNTYLVKKMPSSVTKYADVTVPTLWPNDLFKEAILAGMDQGVTLTYIRLKTGIPLQYFYALLEADQVFYNNVVRLQGYFQDELADRLLKISEDMELDRAVLLSRNTQWYLSRKNAAKYGDRIQVQVTHLDLNQAIEEAKSRVINTTTVTKSIPSLPDDGSDLL